MLNLFTQSGPLQSDSHRENLSEAVLPLKHLSTVVGTTRTKGIFLLNTSCLN